MVGENIILGFQSYALTACLPASLGLEKIIYHSNGGYRGVCHVDQGWHQFFLYRIGRSFRGLLVILVWVSNWGSDGSIWYIEQRAFRVLLIFWFARYWSCTSHWVMEKWFHGKEPRRLPWFSCYAQECKEMNLVQRRLQ